VVRLVVVPVPFIFFDESTGFCFFKTCILVYDCISRACRGHIEGASRARRGHLEGARARKNQRFFLPHAAKSGQSFSFFGQFFPFFPLFPLVERVPDVIWCTIVYRGRSSKKKSEIFPSTCGKKWTVFFFWGHFFLFFSF